MKHKQHNAWSRAICTGDADQVRFLIEDGVQPDLEVACNSDGACRQPIVIAVESGDQDVVQVLLEAGVSADVRSASGDTLLCIAAEAGRVDIVTLLVLSGADINGRCRGDFRPLHYAIHVDDINMTAQLLELGADIEAKDVAGRTMLMLAVADMHLEIADLLLSRGADVNATENFGGNALWIAVEVHQHTGDEDALAMARRLLEHGITQENLNAALALGAGASGDGTAVRLLLEAGGDPCFELRGDSAIEHACRFGSYDNIRTIFEYGDIECINVEQLVELVRSREDDEQARIVQLIKRAERNTM